MKTYTQEEIAQRFGVTRAAVSLVERTALRKLRIGLASDPFVREAVGDDLCDEALAVEAKRRVEA